MLCTFKVMLELDPTRKKSLLFLTGENAATLAIFG